MEQVYDRFRAENGQLGKAEADQLIFREMYAAEPEKRVGHTEDPLLADRQASSRQQGTVSAVRKGFAAVRGGKTVSDPGLLRPMRSGV